MQPPEDPQTTPPDGFTLIPPVQPKKSHHWYRPRNVTIGAGALIVVFVAIGVAGGGGDTPATHPVTATSSQAAPKPSPSQSPDINGVMCIPSTMIDGYCPGDQPAPVPSKPAVYHAISSHKWALIAKDPDAHAGETYFVYGEVTQFDANTGPSAFRADVGGVRQYPDEFGFVNYPTNTVLDGDTSTLGPVVEKDLFTAKVTIVGSLSYDTTLGGSTTVPEVQIDKITVTGHGA